MISSYTDETSDMWYQLQRRSSTIV